MSGLGKHGNSNASSAGGLAVVNDPQLLGRWAPLACTGQQGSRPLLVAAQRRRDNNPSLTFGMDTCSQEKTCHPCFSAQALHISIPLVHSRLG